MDGNGRWATNRFLPRVAGHKEGMSRVIDIVRHASNTGVQVLTLYAFSTENWKRPEEEVSGLMKLLIHYVETQLKTLVEERVQVRVIGDMKAFSPAVADAIRRAVEETEQMDGMILNLALNYGGRAEIVRAFHHLKESGQSQITEQMLSDALDTAGQPDPDLLIRTGAKYGSAISCSIRAPTLSFYLWTPYGRCFILPILTPRSTNTIEGIADLEM